MADYNSSLTGPEIDAALTRAKSGGEIDALLSGKAPAGYGLGESQGKHVANASVDTLTKNGWYYLHDGVTGGPSGYSIYHATLFVSSSRSDLTKVQRLILATSGLQGYELKRVYNDTAWLPWEWVNPPMDVGVEYRTTERYNGKPVYVKAISCGAMPNATTTKVSDEFRATSIISVDGVTSGGTHFPTYSGHTASIGRIDVFVNIYGNIWITTTTDWSNETATIVLKYTKD